jgi:hypothetical protein
MIGSQEIDAERYNDEGQTTSTLQRGIIRLSSGETTQSLLSTLDIF